MLATAEAAPVGRASPGEGFYDGACTLQGASFFVILSTLPSRLLEGINLEPMLIKLNNDNDDGDNNLAREKRGSQQLQKKHLGRCWFVHPLNTDFVALIHLRGP